MRENASKAIQYARSGGERWHEDGLITDAIANRLRQVTELAKYSFPEDEKKDFGQVPWDEMARARDFYTHHYRDLDVELLRTTVEGPLQDLLGVLDELDLPDFGEPSSTE